MNEILRKQVKLLKALQNVSYKEIAEYMDIKTVSFYSWLEGKYNLSEENQKILNEIISNLKEE